MTSATAPCESPREPAAAARGKPTSRSAGAWRLAAAEILGTSILVFFGCGAVHTAVLTGAQSGIWQVAIVWGVAIMLAIYAVGPISGAHINPAITLALALRGRFAWRRVGLYLSAQMAGAIAAAATLLVLFNPWLAAKEHEKGVVRGQRGSEVTAMCYGEYFPSPGPLAAAAGPYDAAEHQRLQALVSPAVAFLAEGLGALVLALVVFALTDERRRPSPAGRLTPACIGLTVAALISVIAPLTQACFNPARDFGPRLVAWMAGWGAVAIPGPNGLGFFTVYVLAPIIGAALGGVLYDLTLRPPAMPPNATERRDKQC